MKHHQPTLSSILVFLALLLTTYSSMATVTCYTVPSALVFKTLTLNNPSISLTGPANKLPVGTSQANWADSGSDNSFFSCQGGFRSSYNPQTWVIAKNQALSGITYTLDGVTYPVFPTQVPGVGYIIGVADPNRTLTPLGNTALNTFIGQNGWGALGIKYLFRYVITGPLKSGITTIPSQTIGEIQMRDGSVDITGSSPIVMSSATLTVNASSCSVNTSNISVALPSTNDTNLKNIGSTSIPSNFNIALSCPSGINTYMVFTDNNNMANTSNLLSLTPSSTAKGIAVQISKADGSLVSFGPDSANPGTSNQFLVLNQLSGMQSLPFSARIIRTGTITPGSFTAISTFTFSYQ